MKLTLGEKLKEIRNRKRLSKEELGKVIGKSHTQIGRYEKGDSMPDAEILQKISEALQFDFLSYAADGVENRNAADLAALGFINIEAMCRVILSMMAEDRAERKGVLVAQELSRVEQAVEAERQAIHKGLLPAK